MLSPIYSQNLRRKALRSISTISGNRFLSSTPIRLRKDPKMSSGPPKHEMVYFPDMTASLPSSSGEFRRVLWTGLYSQVVLMTIPVGGDIGDEVCSALYRHVVFHLQELKGAYCRPGTDLYIWTRQSYHQWQRSGR